MRNWCQTCPCPWLHGLLIRGIIYRGQQGLCHGARSWAHPSPRRHIPHCMEQRPRPQESAVAAEPACRAAPEPPNGVPAPAAAIDTEAMPAKAKASPRLALSPTKPVPKLAVCTAASSSDGLQATGGSGSETPASAPATPSGEATPLSASLRRQLLEAPNVADEIDSLRRQRAERRKEMNEASKKLRQDLPK